MWHMCLCLSKPYPTYSIFPPRKSKIWQIKEKQKKSDEAKIRFEAKQARMEREEQERKARSQRAAEARREELAKTKGEDPVKAALARLKAKKIGTEETNQQKTLTTEKGEVLPDNSDMMALRKARRLARQQNEVKTENLENRIEEAPTAEPQKSAVAAAIARAKAKRLAQVKDAVTTESESTVEKTKENPTALDPKKRR
ncbi:electron transport complex protein RnfC [Rodentibacter pneumotropicus]|uniref:Electron transport complex protein RnfC n=1 Tax=Rodentibacter pneumotropicus TaxID=758 RepID=A0A3S4UQ87_9PAST|nr:electron transport complex protein RnfC [Rodentibacter pneumotropicus]